MAPLWPFPRDQFVFLIHLSMRICAFNARLSVLLDQELAHTSRILGQPDNRCRRSDSRIEVSLFVLLRGVCRDIMLALCWSNALIRLVEFEQHWFDSSAQGIERLLLRLRRVAFMLDEFGHGVASIR